MSFFRTLLWWLLLAAFGALAFELLAPDLGEVLIRWHGLTITTTVAFLLVAWALLWFACWATWTLLRLPFTAWQRLAQSQARHRLVNGLAALQEGRHVRAGNLLERASEDAGVAAVAHNAARQAALRRGDIEAGALHQAELARVDPLSAALNCAETALEQGRPQLALDALQPWSDSRAMPPRALLMRGQALADTGRAVEALSSISQMRQEPGTSPAQMEDLERDWQAAALRQSPHANELHQRWTETTLRLQEDPAVLAAFAQRAGELGLESEAANVLAAAIERHWNEALVRQLAWLPDAREDTRLARAQAWLDDRPSSPALLLALGRLCRRSESLGQAEDLLHRAIAQGAGAPAWEELGKVYTARKDAERAQACYANALRSLRGEPVRSLSGRSLREQIADEAITEMRNEHGLPQLRS